MKILFERDSVCAGDDIGAPNAFNFCVPDDYECPQILEEKNLASYLPSVSRSWVYWDILYGKVKIGEVRHAGELNKTVISLLDAHKVSVLEINEVNNFYFAITGQKRFP